MKSDQRAEGCEREEKHQQGFISKDKAELLAANAYSILQDNFFFFGLVP